MCIRDSLNVEHQKLEAEFQREILALEKKFADKYKPLYDKRAQIVLGSTEPTAAEVEAGEATDERPDEEQDEDEEAEERGEEARREYLLEHLAVSPSSVIST